MLVVKDRGKGMRRKYVILIVIVMLLSVCLVGCSQKYKGENPDLYTVAISNFWGSSGYGNNGEIHISSDVGIIETDPYGRILFYYHEGVTLVGCGYGIMQKSQDGYVYFYDNDCVLPAIDDWDGSGKVTHDDWFTDDILTEFKVRNDWGLPINEEKCAKEKIVNEKPKEKLKLSEEVFSELVTAYLAEQGSACSTETLRVNEKFFIADDYGREMYYMDCYVGNGISYYLAVIFNPDGSYDHSTAVLEIEDLTNYREALKEFKQQNGWNTEYTTAR